MKKYKLRLKQFDGYTFEELIASASISRDGGRKRIFCVVTPQFHEIIYRVETILKNTKTFIETTTIYDAIREFNNIV